MKIRAHAVRIVDIIVVKTIRVQYKRVSTAIIEVIRRKGPELRRAKAIHGALNGIILSYLLQTCKS